MADNESRATRKEPLLLITGTLPTEAPPFSRSHWSAARDGTQKRKTAKITAIISENDLGAGHRDIFHHNRTPPDISEEAQVLPNLCHAVKKLQQVPGYSHS